jgi:peptidoglycan hydrolase-like protein with peptidoglycan-binding domain
MATGLLIGIATTPTEAQTPSPPTLVRPGNVVVTGFSGTRLADKVGDSAKADADGVTIETNGAALRILDVSGVAGPNADPATDSTEVAAYNARAIGQVFGITFDDALDPVTRSPAPNIYTTATSAYGLNIVLPPETETGSPRRTIGGDPAATWMAGQWGEGDAADGKPVAGGPGSVWRIDGVTGKVSLFATISTNGRTTGAPSLGNIAYDSTSHQFFVSDLESGLIHRLSLTGQDLGTFDHGVTARQAAQLPDVADDPAGRADIKSAQFRADDPNTWGYAAPSRRVWGVNVSAGRLYYSVADGPEIWSVAIKADGDFGDSRREIIVPTDQGPFEITDISFDTKGWIYLAQRPPVTGNYDYLFLAAAAPAKVLRYRPDPATNSWTQVPDEYLVGLTAERRQTDGGVTLGYGYGSDGKIDYGTCDGTLWTTGDDMDRSPRKTATIAKSDATDGSAGLNVSGLQGSSTDPNALTVKALRFADYDGILPVTQTRGQIGDVRVFKSCGSPTASATPVTVEQTPDVIDLQIEKLARGPCRLDGVCHVEVRIWNLGNRRYFGPLTIVETLDKAGAKLIDTGPSRWSCGQGGADISCHHPAVEIGSGLSTSLFLDYRLPARWSYPDFADCADIGWLGDFGSPQTIVAVEIELARLGLYTGAVDRVFGPQLQSAIEAYASGHGLANDGTINAPLIEKLFGAGSAIPHDAVKLHDRACASFHVELPETVETYVPPPPTIDYIVPPILTTVVVDQTCPIGYWNRDGECVRSCPWGFKAFGDRCFPSGGPICRDGWLTGGQCTCPSGYASIREPNGHIVCRPAEGIGVQRCFGGFVEGNRCLCPAGTRPQTGPNGSVSCAHFLTPCPGGAFFEGQCRCRPGEAMRDGRCLPAGGPRPVVCPPNDIPINGVCRPRQIGPVHGPGPGQVFCPPGEFPLNGACHPRAPGPVFCPANQILIDGICRPRPGVLNPGGQVNCPPTEILIGGVCRPRPGTLNPGGQVNCPPTEILIGGTCRPRPGVLNPGGQVNCPPNEVRIGDVCRPRIVANPQVNTVTCPPETIKRRNSCMPSLRHDGDHPPLRPPSAAVVRNPTVHTQVRTPPAHVQVRAPTRPAPTRTVIRSIQRPPVQVQHAQPHAPACKLVRGRCV